MTAYIFSDYNGGLYGLYKSIYASSRLLVIVVIYLFLLIVLINLLLTYDMYNLFKALLLVVW